MSTIHVVRAGAKLSRFLFEIAKSHMFFAHRSGGKLDISGCSRTKLVAVAKAELAFIKYANGEVGGQ